jgi:hypothetical protein
MFVMRLPQNSRENRATEAGKVLAATEDVPRLVDEDAPTQQWAKPDQTPIGGVELAALANHRASWDAETFAVRLPPRRKPQSRVLAMTIAGVMSFVICACTFMAVMLLRSENDSTREIQATSLGALPLVDEGVPIATPVSMMPSPETTLSMVATATASPVLLPTASPIALPTAQPTQAPHTPPVPTVRKGKKPH